VHADASELRQKLREKAKRPDQHGVEGMPSVFGHGEWSWSRDIWYGI